MKLTNFTFLRAGNAWLLKSVLPMLVFMTLSLGIEAQTVTPGDQLATQQGMDLVNDNTAIQRLGTHITALMAMNPTTREEEAEIRIRMDVANITLDHVGAGAGYKYYIVSEALDYLEGRAAEFNQRSGKSLEVSEIYGELVDLLRS